MRAKPVNFERGGNPRASMGIGGVVFKDLIDQKRAKRDREIEKLSQAANEQCQEELRKMLIGKKISGEMHKLTKIGEKKVAGVSNFRDFSIEVTDVLMEKLDDQTIIVADTDQNMYAIRFETNTSKIYIE